MTVEIEWRPLWDMVEGPMPRGLLGLGSGDLLSTELEHVQLLGGYSTSFRNRLYRATAPADDDMSSAHWTLDATRGGRARQLVEDAPRGSWDAGGIHTPSYVAANGGQPARIYYAGRGGRRHYGDGSAYSIGVLEWDGTAWLRRDEPVLRGTGDRTSVLEPLVVYFGEAYHLWYLATPHEVAPGEQPDYQLMTTSSANGLDTWSEPEVFASTHEGFFDNALLETPEGWVMVLARGTNLHGTSPFPEQGLWLTTSATPSTRRSDWSEPVRLIDTDAPGTPAWMSAGLCDPALGLHSDGRITVFVTGTRANGGWPRLALSRLRAGKRLPPPAPFFLAAGSGTFRLPKHTFSNSS